MQGRGAPSGAGPGRTLGCRAGDNPRVQGRGAPLGAGQGRPRQEAGAYLDFSSTPKNSCGDGAGRGPSAETVLSVGIWLPAGPNRVPARQASCWPSPAELPWGGTQAFRVGTGGRRSWDRLVGAAVWPFLALNLPQLRRRTCDMKAGNWVASWLA